MTHGSRDGAPPPMPAGTGLPVEAVLGEVRAGLRDARSVVIVAPPGAGKTTVVPLALLDEPWLDGRKIVLLEPRRLATRAAAARMAAMLDEAPGETVGYRIRRDTRVGSATRIEVVTEGVLTRMLQSDPTLEGVGAVIFDELHERSLQADLGLALALASRRLFRDDLRLLVMSATIDAAPIASLLGDAPVVEARGVRHPVEVRYLDRSPDDAVTAAVRSARSVLGEIEGDVLMFLPGIAEIRRAVRDLESAELPPGTELHPLYGDLPRDRQDAAIAPGRPGRQKIVLATSIAQTSLTIEGVRAVIDSGLMRVPRFDPGSGMTRLETLRVTRDVADQRRGRAGRVAPGLCCRMWTEGSQRGLVPALRPEILDADLAPLLLELAVWGASADELDWLDAPPAPALERAAELLERLGALDPGGSATSHGRTMAGLGAHPRVAHMLLRAGPGPEAAIACDLAGLLGSRDPLRRSGAPPDPDVRLRLEALRAARRGRGGWGPHGHEVVRGALRVALAESAQWRRALRLGASDEVTPEAIEHAGDVLATAYPERVARRRPSEPGSSGATRYLLANGRGAGLADTGALSTAEWLVVADLADRQGDARIHLAAPIAREAIEERFADRIDVRREVVWDATAGRVVARRAETLGALTLAETPLADPDAGEVAAALLEGVRQAGIDVLPWTGPTRQLRQRIAFLHHVSTDDWPDMSDAAFLVSLERWLGPFLGGMNRLGDLRRLDLTQVLWSYVGWRRREPLEADAPTHLEVPSGSRIPIDYADPEAPALAVRLQEVFGWRETPRLAGGRVPVVLRLLSPAQRPVQVTGDLASFWRSGYFEVRKELKGRYPKHYWPDDPLTATATRRVRPAE